MYSSLQKQKHYSKTNKTNITNKNNTTRKITIGGETSLERNINKLINLKKEKQINNDELDNLLQNYFGLQNREKIIKLINEENIEKLIKLFKKNLDKGAQKELIKDTNELVNLLTNEYYSLSASNKSSNTSKSSKSTKSSPPGGIASLSTPKSSLKVSVSPKSSHKKKHINKSWCFLL